MGLQPELPSKISTAGFNSIIFPYKTISEDYARMMEANSNIRLAGLNRLPDFLRDAIYGSNRGNGGGSFLLEYSIYIEIPNLVGIMTGNCSMLGVTSNFVCNFSAGGGASDDGDGKDGKNTYSDDKNDFQVDASDYADVLKDHYKSKQGGTYHISIWRFYDMVDAAWSKQAIEFQNAQYDPETGIYTVPVNFYKTDYWASYGRATFQYRMLDDNFKNPMDKIYFIGFHDTWDLDPKPWGIRSVFSEGITRWYNWTIDGQNFDISYP